MSFVNVCVFGDSCSETVATIESQSSYVETSQVRNRSIDRKSFCKIRLFLYHFIEYSVINWRLLFFILNVLFLKNCFGDFFKKISKKVSFFLINCHSSHPSKISRRISSFVSSIPPFPCRNLI